MPDTILTVGPNTCPHHGGVRPPDGPVRVKLGGAVVLTTAARIGGCRNGAGEKHVVPAKPKGSAGAPVEVPVAAPCGEVRWARMANRVKVAGHPVLLARSEGKCLPSEEPVTVGSPVRERVKAT
jgi:hypothetical protein